MQEITNYKAKSDLKQDLRAEASVQCRTVTNTVLGDLKTFAGEYARFFVSRLFDEFIGYVNKKLFS